MTFIPEFLEAMAHVVAKQVPRLPTRGGRPPEKSSFSATELDALFTKTYDDITINNEEKKISSKAPASFWDTKKGQELMKNKGAVPNTPTNPTKDSPPKSVTKRLSKAETAAEKRAKKASEAKKTGGKTKWTNDPTLSARDVDMSDQTAGETPQILTSIEIEDLKFEDDPSEEESDGEIEGEDDPEEASSSNNQGGFGGLFKFIKGLTQKELNETNLKPVMEEMRSHLISKNVASDIASQICESVSNSLKGTSHGNFKLISTTVKNAMAEALTRILTPKRHIDISREIQAAKDVGRPYTIVFVGVNGVGKSTTLAKVCAWLLKQKQQVMIAACDTFRNGAVEQLKDHSKNLGGVPIFEAGYGKDAATICSQAIAKATTDGIDVVLIDTAGRMQDNEPLMAALAALVRGNKPDLILFVGEALVGNDSVDQLTKFNLALEEKGDLVNPRKIDGIVLTKFDTVDDKVGAALSMVYTTGQPIVFVGVGQTYSDIRTLNVKKIVDILARGKV